MTQGVNAYRCRILHFLADPATAGDRAWDFFEDGLLIVENGLIQAVGDAQTLMPNYNGTLEHYPNHLLIPGFIDTHIHFPQMEMIGAYGEQLLSWLNTYTFPTELKFADYAYAQASANVFLDELLRNGTTTALVMATVHPQSVDAFFSAAQERGLRMIAGKVLMDRHAPAALCDSPELSYQQSADLIARWHGVDRLQYAVTPRFAPTSSPAQLEQAGQLLRDHEGLYLHTHLAENSAEVAWVAELFPNSRSYLDVYEQAGLLTRRSIFAHGIYLNDCDCQRLAATGGAIAHCPTSNLFLGSGLLDLERLQMFNIHVGLGTDVGAGTSFSLLRTMDEAYKVQQLRGAQLDPFKAFYLATLGGAVALDLDGQIGNFVAGKEADFIILDLQATPLLRYRLPFCQNLQDLLFALNTLGDDRVVERVYALGQCVHQR